MGTVSTVVFFISKMLRPILTSPLFLVILVVVAALVSLKAAGRRQRLLKGFALGAVLLLGVVSVPAVVNTLARRWEGPLPSLEQIIQKGPFDAIVVLGGALDPVLSAPRKIEGNDAFERLTATAELYRSGAAPLVVVSGGSGSITRPDHKEAPFMAELLSLMGVPDDAILREAASRNTYENAVYTKAILSQRAARRIVLVTSAWHLPRSAAIFRKAGFDFETYPVDSLAEAPLYPADLFPDAWALTRFTRIFREWIGIAAYRLLGRL